MSHTFNSRSKEVEASSPLWMCDQPDLHREFQARWSYMVWQTLPQNNNNKNNQEAGYTVIPSPSSPGTSLSESQNQVIKVWTHTWDPSFQWSEIGPLLAHEGSKEHACHVEKKT